MDYNNPNSIDDDNNQKPNNQHQQQMIQQELYLIQNLQQQQQSLAFFNQLRQQQENQPSASQPPIPSTIPAAPPIFPHNNYYVSFDQFLAQHNANNSTLNGASSAFYPQQAYVPPLLPPSTKDLYLPQQFEQISQLATIGGDCIQPVVGGDINSYLMMSPTEMFQASKPPPGFEYLYQSPSVPAPRPPTPPRPSTPPLPLQPSLPISQKNESKLASYQQKLPQENPSKNKNNKSDKPSESKIKRKEWQSKQQFEILPNAVNPIQSSSSSTSQLMATAHEFVPMKYTNTKNSNQTTIGNDKNKQKTTDITIENIKHDLASMDINENATSDDNHQQNIIGNSTGAVKKTNNLMNNNNNNNNYNNVSTQNNSRYSRNSRGRNRNNDEYQQYDRNNNNNNNNNNPGGYRNNDYHDRGWYSGSGRTTSQYDDNYGSSNKRYLNDENDYHSNANSTHSYNNNNNNTNNNNNVGGTTSSKQKSYKHSTTGNTLNSTVSQSSTASSSTLPTTTSTTNATKHSTNHPDYQPNRNLKLNTSIDKLPPTDCSQREKLIREIDGGKLECLVCCEIIKPFQSSWSCQNCYHILHLNCCIKWAASSRSDDGWRCPACQNITKSVPYQYYCFCGKLRNPQYNRNDVAHSCGDVCERADQCEHSCTLLCHPGPCPPCQASVKRVCGCGSTTKMMQCSQRDELQCDGICDKLLNCEVHTCLLKCHHGDCTTCDEKIQQQCYCGKDNRDVPCTLEANSTKNYTCGKLCNKSFKCKKHKCKRVCHDGDCGDCMLLPELITSCPCGKRKILPDERKLCTDPIQMCTATCGKPLRCGGGGFSGNNVQHHKCTMKCHLGDCVCNKETSVRCRCGQAEQMIKCRQLETSQANVLCKKRCIKKRSCGKHKCNEECCIDLEHICQIPCTHSLSCGKHKCDRTCHKGRCHPCYRSSFDELHCECGANVIYPPVPCGTKKPACDRPCPRSHSCDHPVAHNCHSAAQCPPCMAFTTKYCYGKHEQRKTIPCSQEDFSCGLPCNKQLRCGKHKCLKICHIGVCETEQDVCRQNCTTVRIMCSHNCNAPCHTGKDCPDIPCRENVEVLCQCGLRKQTRTCHDFSSEFRRIATSKLASTMHDMQMGNSFELSDVLGPVKISNNKTLECTEECSLAERNRKISLALQIRNPDLSSKLHPKYSEFIRTWGKKDPHMVGMIHDRLTELVKLAKESVQKSRSYSFPTMNREKRRLVHEMCGMFGVESVAYDAEPNRNVVATATRDTSWFPSLSILEVLQRENGQRRIPVPSNKAWGFKH